jgi:hypothetical protein
MTPANVWTVVLNWNGAADTAACLESLRSVRVPEGVADARVTDNGSTDGSPSACPRSFLRCAWSAWREPALGGGNNKGLALALDGGADGVLLLNNDTGRSLIASSTCSRPCVRTPKAACSGRRSCRGTARRCGRPAETGLPGWAGGVIASSAGRGRIRPRMHASSRAAT